MAPYFMGPRGMYLNRWTLDFDPEVDVPSAIPIWVYLPYLPLHCWSEKSLEAIGYALVKYINKSEPKGEMLACARIYVEVDLEKGFLEARNLTLDNFTTNNYP